MNPKHVSAIASALAALASAAPAAAHSVHTVQPGESLWSIAAANDFSMGALAAANGLSEDGVIVVGQTIQIPSASAAPTTSGPEPTAETVSPWVVQEVALQHGVSPSLAAAIAEQESGFNNALVSSADARGVMQITPAAWQFVQANLAAYPLQAASAHDNVQAGVIYLAQLLRETGGDELAATAAYYQGLTSVRSIGLLPETQTYVNNVMALRSGYGG